MKKEILKQELYELESEVYKKIAIIKDKRQAENKAFAEGLEKGADLMFEAFRAALNKEDTDNDRT